MALRIRAAIAAGCTQITTETGEPVADEPNPSLVNMRYCGFKQVCSRLNDAGEQLALSLLKPTLAPRQPRPPRSTPANGCACARPIRWRPR